MTDLIYKYQLTADNSVPQDRFKAVNLTRQACITLNPTDKRRLLTFLYERQLIGTPTPIVPLGEVFLAPVDLRGVDLPFSDLSRTDLRGIDMRGADFHNANLRIHAI